MTLQSQYKAIDNYCNTQLKQGQKLMRKILIGILHLIHKTEYQMNLENKKDDLAHAEVMRILETGMQQQMLQELIQERMNQEHLDIQGKQSDKESK